MKENIVWAQEKHSLILSNCFILVRVLVNVEPIPGTLRVRQKYTLGRMLAHYMNNAPAFTHIIKVNLDLPMSQRKTVES